MSVLTEPALDRPRLLVLPAPNADPPYDEVGGGEGFSPIRTGGDDQGTLLLRFVLPTGLSALPVPRPDVAPTVDDVAAVGADDRDRAFDRRRTSTSELPDARSWSTRLAQAAVEVLGGARPLSQLRRWTSDEVYAQLSRNSRRRSARVSEPRRRPDRPPRVIVRAVQVCEVADGVVEASAVVDDGRRARAIALRIEGADGRWRCTQLAAL